MHISQLASEIKRIADTMPAIIAREVVNFSMERFDEQNWYDTAKEPWQKRKTEGWGRKKREGRALLIDTGRGRRSLRADAEGNTIVLKSDVEYMQVHNEGFEGVVKQNVRSHTRKLTAKKGKKRIVRGTVNVHAFSRTISQKIPKRQFAGNSAKLRENIINLIVNRFKMLQ
jgi:phage gpG-like protein